MIQAHSSFPIFIVGNINAAREFYTQHFGFDIAFENEWYLHLVTASGIQVGFMLPDQPTQPDIFKQGSDGTGVIFSFEVKDADSAYSHATNASLNIVLQLRSEDWGQRHFCVRDPNGICLDIVQEIEPTQEYKQGYAGE